jgi:hypothetical protein
MPGKLKSGAFDPMASVPGSLKPNANEEKQSMHKNRWIKTRKDFFIFEKLFNNTTQGKICNIY